MVPRRSAPLPGWTRPLAFRVRAPDESRAPATESKLREAPPLTRAAQPGPMWSRIRGCGAVHPRGPRSVRARRQRSRRRLSMAENFEYISRARLEYRGGARHAFLGEVPEPVVYGVQGALREYYGVPPGPPVASTLDHIVAAVAG